MAEKEESGLLDVLWQEITNFAMESGAGPKTNMTCLIDATRVMGKSQRSASALHGLHFVFRKWGSDHQA